MIGYILTPELTWRNLVQNPSKELVRGTQLAMAYVPGTQSRFAIYETRTLDNAGNIGVIYRLRDAALSTNAMIARQEHPPIVGVFNDWPEAVECALRAFDNQ